MHQSHAPTIQERFFHFLRWVFPPAKRFLPPEMHEHHDHTHPIHPPWYQEQPRLWNYLAARTEFVLLQIIDKITNIVPKVIIKRIVAPLIGMPIQMPVHQVVPIEVLNRLIDDYEIHHIPIWIGLCPCRRALTKYSDEPIRNFTDIVFGDWGKEYSKVLPQCFKQISYATCRSLFAKFDQMGLVHTLYAFCGTGTMQAVVCNCDSSVCVPLHFYKTTGVRSFTNSPFELNYNPTKCIGCQQCISKCQSNARKWNPTTQKIDISKEWCIGCGSCREVCSQKANFLVRNPNQPLVVAPPCYLNEK